MVSEGSVQSYVDKDQDVGCLKALARPLLVLACISANRVDVCCDNWEELANDVVVIGGQLKARLSVVRYRRERSAFNFVGWGARERGERSN